MRFRYWSNSSSFWSTSCVSLTPTPCPLPEAPALRFAISWFTRDVTLGMWQTEMHVANH